MATMWRYAETLQQIVFKTKKKLLKVYEDFGDVRYEGDRYVAFAKWWNAKLANGETKGAYLFAQPLTEMKVYVFDKMKDERKKMILSEADKFIKQNTIQ